ncbi:DUF4864 domain-containing protein [Parachlamydia sp. AcF125]|uniref:DUF4864 domain-containing protein n=1 Tax=Parachlamydia sp. AcF125 TaxID=2795736 RepID=UPI001BD8E26E|nr:DUF4864 domain-containing protein [Parachlamydia sp. AcF125]MBS4167736.1 hypothetical protein [Parachlamydia sp. AcF125]
MFCTNCGALLEDNSRFCPACGKKADWQNPIQPPPLPKKSFSWKKGVLILACLALLFYAFLYEASKELTETVEKQLEALRTHQVTEAYYSFTSKEFQNTIGLEKFREFIQHYPSFYENKTVNFYESTFGNNLLTLKGVLISQDNRQLNVEYQLVDEEGTWKILSIKILESPPANAPSEQNDHSQLPY